ncbi:MAG TPA: hypothetical protein VMV89_05730 [Candidatus Paceibacterota bacterium]|nr:hypothetical protein [Candidatus Paceibacterota bacterium]
MKKPKPIHSEEYNCEGTLFRIDIFKTRFGGFPEKYGFAGCWMRLRDGYSGGSSAYCNSIPKAVAVNQMNAFPHRT